MSTSIHPFEDQRVVYVEVPKAGCTSIKWVLRSLRGDWGGEPDASFHRWFGYRHVDSARLGQVLDEQFPGWKKFTVIREPGARLVSLYHNIVRCSNEWKGAQCASLHDFVRNFERSGWRHDGHGRPQTEIVGEDLSIYDFVGRTEDMAAVFAYLRDLFDLPGVAEASCNRSHYSEYLAEEDGAILSRVFARDYEVLPYDPPGGTARQTTP